MLGGEIRVENNAGKNANASGVYHSCLPACERELSYNRKYKG